MLPLRYAASIGFGALLGLLGCLMNVDENLWTYDAAPCKKPPCDGGVPDNRIDSGPPRCRWAPVSVGTTADLNAVWGSSSSDIWIVGDHGVMFHRTGSGWTSVAPALDKDLYAVHGTAPDNILAVGAEGTILRHDGTAWAVVTAPGNAHLLGVFAASTGQGWAVGASGAIYRIQGASATQETSPTTTTLHDVWGSSADDVWAVGESGVILHRTAGAWSLATSGTTARLQAITGTGPTDVWVVGDCADKPGRCPSTILHYNGTAWSKAFTTPDGVILKALVAINSQSVWSVGYGCCGNSCSCDNALRYDGTWSAAAFGKAKPLEGVWGVGTCDLWAVGADGTVLRYVFQ